MGCTTMRSLAVVVVVLLGARVVVHADGVYFSEMAGGAAYRGDLHAYGDGALRLQFGVGWRRGSPRQPHWSFELVGGGLINEASELWCSANTCEVANREGDYNFVGVDIKRRWPVAQSRWTGLGARFGLHAGPRMYWGNGALTGYDGVGINAGASIEGDIWVLGYVLDFGVDTMWMRIPVDSVVGAAPYVMLGGRVGWL